MIPCLLSALCLAIWLYLMVARGGFWRMRETDDLLIPIADDAARTIRVAAIVPARNEADLIGQSAQSLLRQNCAAQFELVIVDDMSNDGTSDVARAAAAAIGAQERLTVLQGTEPPPGWTGKLNAMNRGLHFVSDRPNPPDYIFFTDADIAHAPDVLARLLGGAVAGDRVLVSLMAKLACESRAERWLTPAFVYFFDMLYPFAWVNDPKKSTAAAAGGCMLIQRKALDEAGGLEAIRDALIDDCAMGQALKRVGPIWLGLTHRVVSLRPYASFSDIKHMVMRSAYAQLNYSPLQLFGSCLGMIVTFLLPLILSFDADPPVGFPAFIALILMAASCRPILRFYGLSAWRGLNLPFVAALYTIFTLESARAYYQGRGGAWKGRYQANRANEAKKT